MNVTKADEGDYRCMARSMAGQAHVTIQIDVQCMFCVSAVSLLLYILSENISHILHFLKTLDKSSPVSVICGAKN